MQRRPTRAYRNAYAALYGDKQLELGAERKARDGQKKAVPTEVYEQIVLATWLTKNDILFFHVPNGGYRDAREGAKFKRMGVKAGIPDLVIPIARSCYHGAFLELKRVSGGTLSDAQKYWRDILRSQGYFWAEAKGAQEGIRIVREYLDAK